MGKSLAGYGVGGTIVFTVLWFATHAHNLFGGGLGGHMPEGAPLGNASQGGFPQGDSGGEHFPRGHPSRGIASMPQLEFFQIAFIGLCNPCHDDLKKAKS
ncbi:MAG: hypothetical protein KGI25_04720 [Thaumarchaeota archaeon]|nr:hypothetical protein [Nitrososphaerota archaeon]